MKVAVFFMSGHKRSSVCAQAMHQGIRAVGDEAVLIEHALHRSGQADYDACVFYGFTHPLQRIMDDYKAAGKPAVYIDLGYWGRVKSDGHHKVVVDGRHPTKYFQRFKHDNARAQAFGIEVAPWRTQGSHVLIAGMGYKAAVIAEHMGFEAFEREQIALLRQHSAREIIYRPKPSCGLSGEINGTTYSPSTQPLRDVFVNCHAVVTHHSNVAVEAIVAGIPAFCWEGVAAPLALQDCTRIESPYMPDDREQWVNDIAYTQWTWTEMAAGLPWRHLKNEGLVS